MTECRAALEEVQKALAACKEENAVLTDTLKEQASKIFSYEVCHFVSHVFFVCHHLTDMKHTVWSQKLASEATSWQYCASQSSLLQPHI